MVAAVHSGARPCLVGVGFLVENCSAGQGESQGVKRAKRLRGVTRKNMGDSGSASRGLVVRVKAGQVPMLRNI